MKKIAFGFACGFTAIFIFVMMLTVYGRVTRQEETELALSQAIESTLSGAMEEENRRILDDKGMVADFLQTLLIQANSESDITVSVLDADCKRGILSAEVTEAYRHPNGREGTVSAVRTVIFDKPREPEVKEIRKVRFYTADHKLYKEYRLQKDSFCMVPAPPVKKGADFCGWRFMSGGMGKAGSMRMDGANGSREILTAGGVPYQVSEHTSLIAVFQ